MPPPVKFSIGDDALPGNEGSTWFQFVTATGQPPIPQQRIERLTFPGTAYARYRRLGVGGRETFQIRTTRDTVDIDAAVALAKQYATLVGAGQQKLIWADHDYTTSGWQVVVLGVDPEEIATVSTWCGGFDDANNKAKLVANWQLEFRMV